MVVQVDLIIARCASFHLPIANRSRTAMRTPALAPAAWFHHFLTALCVFVVLGPERDLRHPPPLKGSPAPRSSRPRRRAERAAELGRTVAPRGVGFAHILTHPLRVGSPFAELLRFLRIRHFLSSRPPLPPWHGAQMLRHSDCPQTPTCQGRLARHPRPRAPGACTPS